MRQLQERLKIFTGQVAEAGGHLGKIPGIGPPGVDGSHQPIGVSARVAPEKLCLLRNPVSWGGGPAVSAALLHPSHTGIVAGRESGGWILHRQLLPHKNVV